MSRASSTPDTRASQKRKKKKKGKALKVLCVAFVGLLGVVLIAGAVVVALGRGLLSLVGKDDGSEVKPIVWNDADNVSQPDEHVDLSHLEVRGNTDQITNLNSAPTSKP